MLNICVVVGISPVIGVPLPFISAGGSALVACLIAMGIMLSCARAEPGANEVLMAREASIKQTIA
ncbi:FtsW/RodA/SpoVE family cell cycle protein, partial [Bacillus cereus]|uniref:FtsW/RodA/SpoVE family cell cycle protein n=1 Tax=Bacillus cereus TaxID=1396 RepID=UPI0028525E4C